VRDYPLTIPSCAKRECDQPDPSEEQKKGATVLKITPIGQVGADYKGLRGYGIRLEKNPDHEFVKEVQYPSQNTLNIHAWLNSKHHGRKACPLLYREGSKKSCFVFGDYPQESPAIAPCEQVVRSRQGSIKSSGDQSQSQSSSSRRSSIK
jgi:hypothetical protein